MFLESLWAPAAVVAGVVALLLYVVLGRRGWQHTSMSAWLAPALALGVGGLAGPRVPHHEALVRPWCVVHAGDDRVHATPTTGGTYVASTDAKLPPPVRGCRRGNVRVSRATVEGFPMATRDDLPAPTEGLLLTHFITVRDVAAARRFYVDVFGGEVVQEENPAIVKIANGWIIMNPGGGPTPDKPGISLRAPEPGDPVTSFLNVRVADIAAFYADATAKGAQFVTEPLDRKAELRCYLRDPDGYLIEVGQATGILEGILADPPAGSGR